MKYLKPIFIALLCIGFFGYGMISLEYKYFPYSYVMSIKNYIDHTKNQYQSTEVLNSFFHQLLVKKIFIDDDLFRGGGLTEEDGYIFLIENKGKIHIFDIETYSKVDVTLDNIPMNIGGLQESQHPSRNDFRMEWFRVSGIFAEKISPNLFRLHVSHNSYDKKNDCISFNISSIELKAYGNSMKASGHWNTIFTAKPCIDPNPEIFSSREPYVGHISGGKIIEHNDSTLMVSVGDYDKNGLNNSPSFAQDSNKPYGKILLVDKLSGDWSIYAKGVRNPLGLYKDQDGTIWETENGPQGGDELNIIKKGANYGWPDVSYGVWYIEEYELDKGNLLGHHNFDYEKPAFSWIPSIAPNNLVRIEGDKFDHWKGDLLIGTMRELSLYRLRLSEDNRVQYSERIYLGHRVRDLTVLPDNTIALITDDGFLIIIEDGGSVFLEEEQEALQRAKRLENYDRLKDQEYKERSMSPNMSSKIVFERNCSSCHNLSPKNTVGPHLNNLFSREVGGLDDYNYSTTLTRDGRTWSPSLLSRFLLDPENEFANSNMTKVNLTAEEVDSIIQLLQN